MGIGKIAVSILIGLALQVLLLCLIFVGGIAQLVPIILIAIAIEILKVCI